MCDEKKRMVIKQGSGVPTIPTSADHRNGDWISTDIYQGEMYLDTDTGIVYTRDANGITMNGSTPCKTYKAIISQASTSAPSTVLLIQNNIGTITLTRESVGFYKINGTGLFTEGKTFFYQPSPSALTHQIIIKKTDNNDDVRLYTYISGSLSDDVLIKTNIHIEVYA